MPANDAQRRSRSFLLPVEDTEFLLRRELRGIRFALEFHKADLALQDRKIRSTIVVFGSSRIPAPEDADAMLSRAVTEPQRKRAAALVKQAGFYESARLFGRIVSQRGGALAPADGWLDNVIATGGGPGIMEAANRGASEVGAPSIGFNITLPAEQAPNAYSSPDLTFRFHYFAMRKMHLVMRANALAVFPGGFGTLDELFEILTLQQTRKAAKMPVVLIGADYWRRVIDFGAFVAHGMVDADDLGLFDIVDDAEAAWESLQRRGLAAHAPGRAG
ncbi:MAG: LOG family protein [Alphaproteobacteria bacterium]|nr:LOG family protein [Alphaproteobacteria bacterium]